MGMAKSKIIKVLIFSWLAVVILCSCFVSVTANQSIKDISVSIILSNISANTNYTKFIRVTNNDDEAGINDNLSMIVHINFSQCNDNKTNESVWNVSKLINSYSESGFGTLFFAEGNYSLCVHIEPINFIDEKTENNVACKNFTTYAFDDFMDENSNMTNTENSTLNLTENISVNITVNITEDVIYNTTENTTTENETSQNVTEINLNESQQNENLSFCDCKLQILTDKQIFVDGEKIEFTIVDCDNFSKFIFPVEYWVEDREKIVKQIINTTSKTKKTYTPSIDVTEKYFVIKSKFSDCQNISDKIVVFVKTIEKQIAFLEISAPEEEDSEIIYVTLNGFKADSDKTLISLWLEKNGEKFSDTTKVYVNNKNVNFEFKVPVFTEVEKSGSYTIVAEGLDETDEKEIKIIRDEKTSVEKSVKKNNDAEIKLETQTSNVGKITSFYTRKQTFEKNILVYINVEGMENKILRISSGAETKEITDISEKNVLNISISSEKDVILAELLDKTSEGKIIDSKELKLNLSLNENLMNELGKKNSSNITEKKTSLNSVSSKIVLNLTNSYSNYLYDKNTSIINESKQNILTGRVVFSNKLNFKKNALFLLIAIIICFITFNKKARRFLLFIKHKIALEIRELFLQSKNFSFKKRKFFK